jgi:ATP-dependent exoDNAse (exonuclease V) alpha subunit
MDREDSAELFLNSDAVGDDFFIDIVEKKLNLSRDQFKLRLVLLSPATGKNENFVAVLYRAKIKIEILETRSIQSIDVIIKALLSTLKEFKEFSVFPRERFVYENIITSFETIWYERTQEKIQFAPRSIKFETDPYEIIVLDDLKAGKYEMLNRKVGLNMEQTKMLLTKLAKFHAASAIRYQQVDKNYQADSPD